MFKKNDNNLIGTILQVMLGAGLVVSTSVLIHANSSETSIVDKLLLLEQRCVEADSIKQRISLNPSCMLELDQMFLEEPTWKYDVVPTFGGVNGGDFHNHSSSLNFRGNKLKFTVEDYLDEDVPTWGQIFDGRYVERKAVTTRVMHKNECKRHLNVWNDDSVLTQQCHTRDLVIYAISLDACTSAFNLYRSSHKKYRRDSRSNFENGLNRLREFWRTSESGFDQSVTTTPPVDATTYIRSSLWMLWVLEKCSDTSIAYFGFAVDFFNLGETENLDEINLSNLANRRVRIGVEQLEKYVRPSYKSAINSAARLGDSWALRSISPPKPEDEPKFWQLLYEKYPSLYHRYMSSDRVNSKLTVAAKLTHAFKAFELFRSKESASSSDQEYGRRFNPTEKFGDYVYLGGYSFRGIKEQYSLKLLNSLTSIEAVAAAIPDKKASVYAGRVKKSDLPAGTTVITSETP